MYGRLTRSLAKSTYNDLHTYRKRGQVFTCLESTADWNKHFDKLKAVRQYGLPREILIPRAAWKLALYILPSTLSKTAFLVNTLTATGPAQERAPT